MSAANTNLGIIHAYRHLMRAGLRAVCFSKPSRYTIRDILREGFRDPKATFEPVAVERTIMFLQAAQRKGFEHKLLKSLTRVSWDRRRRQRIGWSWQTVLPEIKRRAGKRFKTSPVDGKEYEHFDRTLAMLNDTATLCLRI